MDFSLDQQILTSVKNSGLIKYFSDDIELPDMNREIILNLMSRPVKIFLHDNKLSYKNEDGEIVTCPEVSGNVSDSGMWLSDFIDPPGFDIQASGNLRKALECESLYICLKIIKILNDNAFTSDFRNLINDYEFDKMCSKGDSNSFQELLSSWQKLQSN